MKKVLDHVSEHEVIEFSTKVKSKKTYFKALINWLPAMTKNGSEVVVLLNDVTNFKTFEKSQTAFFANASHELKTPLSVLSGFIETLQGPAKDDVNAREKFLNIMWKAKPSKRFLNWQKLKRAPSAITIKIFIANWVSVP